MSLLPQRQASLKFNHNETHFIVHTFIMKEHLQIVEIFQTVHLENKIKLALWSRQPYFLIQVTRY